MAHLIFSRQMGVERPGILVVRDNSDLVSNKMVPQKVVKI